MEADCSRKFLNLLPFGIPTLIIADDPQLLSAAAAAYAHWLVEAPVTEAVIEIRLETGSPSTADVSRDIAVDGSRLRVEGGGAEGTADAATGKANATIAPSLLEDAADFTDVLDTLLLFLLARRGRTPVHAAAFMIGDLAIVLAGSSGSGKSTLALAASKAAFPVLSDDMVFVQQEPGFALWGFPRPIHVYSGDAPPGDHPTRLRNYKRKVAVLARAHALKSSRAALVLLERGSELSLSPADPRWAVESLMNLDAGFDLLREESRAAIGSLASRGAWRLTLTDDPAAAIDLLGARFAAQP
jgi:hypothetical protein